MNKSQLLINEPPLTVSPTLAKIIGLEEAVLIQQVNYWLTNNKNTGRIEEGEKWVFNTYEEWQEDNFPFWSVDKIQRLFLKLEKQGLIISRQFDAKSRDMRKFYRIDYDAICTLHDAILRPSNTANLHDVNNESETTTEKHTSFQRGEQERPDKINEWLNMMHFPGAKQSERIDAILSYLGVTFHRNTETKEWKEFAKYIISAEKEFGWKVEDFIKWLFSKPDYHPDYWSVKRMMEFYPSAFEQEKKSVIESTPLEQWRNEIKL